MAADKQIELLKKLKALAERGEGGEKEGAERKLRELMEKYHVEDADLDDNALVMNEFRYRGPEELNILQQVAYKVLGHLPKMRSYSAGRGSKTTILIESTEAQKIQILIEFEFFRSLWEEEKSLFLKAFIQKHRLFGKPEPGKETRAGLTMEEMARLNAMQRTMQDKELVKMIEGK